MPDGAWGESFEACLSKQFVFHPQKSQVTMTAWALMALMAAKFPDVSKLEPGVRLLIARQQSDGSWPQESITGVFNKTCMISYPNYQQIFPMWALSRFSQYTRK